MIMSSYKTGIANQIKNDKIKKVESLSLETTFNFCEEMISENFLAKDT
jgi:hypothetical protein